MLKAKSIFKVLKLPWNTGPHAVVTVNQSVVLRNSTVHIFIRQMHQQKYNQDKKKGFRQSLKDYSKWRKNFPSGAYGIIVFVAST